MVFRTVLTGFSALAAMTAAAVPAAAEMITANDPAKIAALLKEKGYRAEIIEGEDTTYVRSADSGVPVTIFFLNCEAKKCSTIQFYTGFSDRKNVSLERINDWNKNRRFARAYIDNDGDPVIEMDVDMDHQGIARENFYANLDIFLASIPKFKEHLVGK
jgi:hypothetical protein